MNGRPDPGSGTLLGIAVIGGTVALLALLVPLSAGLLVRGCVDGAADASALAAADVAAGRSPGFPCDVARLVAAANHARLTVCAVDGLVVTVHATSTFWGISITSSATAGPPVAGTN